MNKLLILGPVTGLTLGAMNPKNLKFLSSRESIPSDISMLDNFDIDHLKRYWKGMSSIGDERRGKWCILKLSVLTGTQCSKLVVMFYLVATA